jgi:hypothetical protein
MAREDYISSANRPFPHGVTGMFFLSLSTLQGLRMHTSPEITPVPPDPPRTL